MGVVIRPATLRDASYVLANLRPGDEREAMCQVPDGTKNYELAYALLHSGDNFVALVDDNPAAFFGTQAINAVCYTVWALGTNRMHRAIPRITTFLTNEHGPKLREAGIRMLEARSIEDHAEAHLWMHSTGAVQSGEPYVFGKNGERFITFRWTEDFGARKKSHGWRAR